jgi:hypothetical protein
LPGSKGLASVPEFELLQVLAAIVELQPDVQLPEEVHLKKLFKKRGVISIVQTSRDIDTSYFCNFKTSISYMLIFSPTPLAPPFHLKTLLLFTWLEL